MRKYKKSLKCVYEKKWKRHTLTKQPGHTVVTAIWAAVLKSAWTTAGPTFTPSSAASDAVYHNIFLSGLGVYWTVIIMKVAVCVRCKSMNSI